MGLKGLEQASATRCQRLSEEGKSSAQKLQRQIFGPRGEGRCGTKLSTNFSPCHLLGERVRLASVPRVNYGCEWGIRQARPLILAIKLGSGLVGRGQGSLV